MSSQILSVAYSKDGSLVYISGIDNDISVFDVRKTGDDFESDPLFRLQGHRDAITSISLSKDASYLLSNSRDNTLRIWDAKAYSNRENRCLKIFQGSTHNADNNLIRASWSPNGSMVTLLW